MKKNTQELNPILNSGCYSNIIVKKSNKYIDDDDGIAYIDIIAYNNKIKVNECYIVGDDFLINQLKLAKTN